VRPDLSIVIPSHRRADLLEWCLRSVVLARPDNAEVIVVDDGSPGGIVSETANRFSPVRVIRSTKARGFAAAANAGIALATGRVVEMLNDDAEVTPGWAEAALARFEDPAIAAVAPLVLIHPSTRRSSHPVVDSVGDHYDRGGFAFKRGHGERLAAKHLVPGPCESVCAAAGFFRHDALTRLGGFAETFGAYFEDVDLSLRLRKTGARLEFEPRSVVWHHVSASYRQIPSRRTLERQSCNEERLFWRHIQPHRRRYDISRHISVLAAKLLRRQSENRVCPWITGRLRSAWNAFLLGTNC
jgi:GT2 family glycosyltransferase